VFEVFFPGIFVGLESQEEISSIGRPSYRLTSFTIIKAPHLKVVILMSPAFEI